jgi:voltage-gated sodium channel
MINFCKKIADSEQFQTFILWIILLTAASMGLETVPELQENFGLWFEGFFYLTQAIFVFEMFVRFFAFAPRFSGFFGEARNSFDLLIVIASFLPGPGAMAPIIRLVRVLRVLRVVSVSDRLRRFLDNMRHTWDELFYAAIIVFVLGYIFSIAGHYLFVDIAPERWGSLGAAALSVFYLLLLQEIPATVNELVASAPAAIFYFIIFYFVFISLLLNVVGLISSEHQGRKDV